MSEPAMNRRMSVDEYLRFEEAAPTKHEYVAGDVYAMTGVTYRHACIVTNVAYRLAGAARAGSCRVVHDVKVRAGDRIYYPDVMVLCTPQSADALVLGDPCLVVEVTSRSTARVDRGEKLDAYRTVPSLRAYLIVDHRWRRVERHWRDAVGAWQREEIAVDGSVPVPCPEMALTLDEIYEGVQFAVLGEPEPPDYERDGAEEDDLAYDEI